MFVFERFGSDLSLFVLDSNWLEWLSLLQCKAVEGAGSDKAEFFHLYFVWAGLLIISFD